MDLIFSIKRKKLQNNWLIEHYQITLLIQKKDFLIYFKNSVFMIDFNRNKILKEVLIKWININRILNTYLNLVCIRLEKEEKSDLLKLIELEIELIIIDLK